MTRITLTNTKIFSALKLPCCLTLLFLSVAHSQTSAIPVSTQDVEANSPSVIGQWSAPVAWPMVAIHTSVLPNGKVLFWSPEGGSANSTVTRVWNPATNAFISVTNPTTNLFCSGHSFLPDGRLLVSGGHLGVFLGEEHTNIFDSTNNTWSRGPVMNAGRWYPSNCTLGNGEVLIAAGTDKTGQPNKLPQVWQPIGPVGTLRSLTGAANEMLHYYPWLFVATDGRVFNAGPERLTRFLDTAGTGRWSAGPSSNFGLRDEGSAVIYDDGKVLIAAGGDPPVNSAEVINLNLDVPKWRTVQQPMAFARRFHNATILADGKVLVTGGTTTPGFNFDAGTVLAAELWDPRTEKWSTAASMRVSRIYHSTAVLLPDGRVLSAGGGIPPSQDDLINHLDMEIYSPPYLFKGARPDITFAPAVVKPGETFVVKTSKAGSIAEVTWVRLSSVTHSFNENQRINYLSFKVASATGLTVTAPASNYLCPPGHYMLFLINSAGAASVAKIVKITASPQPVNAINDSRFFARQHFYDFYNREPFNQTLLSFARQITGCNDDAACIAQKRIEVSRSFWDSGEFAQKYPAAINPSGNPKFNNAEFVKLCYRLYMRREGDPGGLNNWLTQLNRANDYNLIIKGFINSAEYRARFD